MCARRFLMLIFILTLIAVGGAFAIFQFGGNVLLRQATPEGHFVAPSPRSGPNYSALDSWIARPDIPNNPAQWRPEKFSEAPPGVSDRYLGLPRPPFAVAAFYIHPTTYLRTDRWNGPLDDPDSRARAELFARSQASAFADTAEVWAPRYRQAAYGAFLLESDDARKALDLAYSDVRAAFDEFLKRIPPDRPIILAGHSQGALHLSRLLAEQGGKLKSRLIAAYVVGWPISTTADLPALDLPACDAAERNGCLLAWQSFAEPANPELILDAWEETPGLDGSKRRREDLLCVNPISGIVNGSAQPLDNPGTLVPTADLSSAALLAGRVGARCDKGLLVLEGEVPALGPYVLPGNNYHVYDFALFWAAVARDANRRAMAWR